MLVVTREGDRRCKLRPSQRAMVALVSTRAHHSGEDRRRVRDQRVHRPLLHPRGRRPARRTSTGSAQDAARARSRLHPARRHPRRVRPGRRRPGRLLPQTPAPRRERAGRHRPLRPAAVALARPAGRIKRKPLQELTPTEKILNRALAAARAPVERGVASLKSWRIFRRSRCSPNRMTPILKAILTLERQR